MDIQWYPGHMAKAKRLLVTQLSKVDLVIELCDARLPHSSRNPALVSMIARKRRVLLLCKADLAQESQTAKWLQYYKSVGIEAIPYDASTQRTKQARALIEAAASDVIKRGERRGIQKTIRAMVVGVPNVGKSTLINRLYGASIAQTGDKPGVTVSNRWIKVNPYLEVLDTPGLLWPKLNDQTAAARLAYIGTINDAVIDQEALCESLLTDLLRVMPQQTLERYRIKNAEAKGEALLEEVCHGRGFLMRGGICDIDRACAVILDEFREGKVGRLTLEEAPAPVREAVSYEQSE